MRLAFVAALALLSAIAMLLPAAAPDTYFEDRSARSGIGFVLRNAASPEKHLIETMAGGVAVFDYDSDGYPDIYFANGAAQQAMLTVSSRVTGSVA